MTEAVTVIAPIQVQEGLVTAVPQVSTAPLT